MSASSKVTPQRLAAVTVALVTLLLAAALQASAAVESGHRSPPASFGTAFRGAAPVGNGPSTLAIDRATHTAYVANGNNANGGNVGETRCPSSTRAGATPTTRAPATDRGGP